MKRFTLLIALLILSTFVVFATDTGFSGGFAMKIAPNMESSLLVEYDFGRVYLDTSFNFFYFAMDNPSGTIDYDYSDSDGTSFENSMEFPGDNVDKIHLSITKLGIGFGGGYSLIEKERLEFRVGARINVNYLGAGAEVDLKDGSYSREITIVGNFFMNDVDVYSGFWFYPFKDVPEIGMAFAYVGEFGWLSKINGELSSDYVNGAYWENSTYGFGMDLGTKWINTYPTVYLFGKF